MSDEPTEDEERETGEAGADLAAPVLELLRELPGSSAEALAEALDAEPADVRRALQALEAAGAARADSRAEPVTYTAAGGVGGSRKVVRKARPREAPGGPAGGDPDSAH